MRSRATAPDLYHRIVEVAARDAWKRAVQVLGCNYRLGIIEAAELHVITPSIFGALFGAAVDVPSRERVLDRIHTAAAGRLFIPPPSRN